MKKKGKKKFFLYRTWMGYCPIELGERRRGRWGAGLGAGRWARGRASTGLGGKRTSAGRR